ncbi:MAG: AmmeMemoRadiSam system protein A [Spirochaetaceae bacterium]|jgi:AmmeMemoRadiSam system protein A|nr:AmmeMemoRadiSam system protein A [Spirochaetaceae bacterium]
MNFTITPEEQRALLADARETIAATLENRLPVYQRGPELKKAVLAGTSALAQKSGAFVTLHAERARKRVLRGCIGRMAASESLEKTVRLMASEAAFADPRFPSLTLEELGRCHIEISALSPMELCPDPRLVRVGFHGLYLVNQGRSGVLLPQVPTEQGWNLDEYLDYICVKAGLPPRSYDEPGAKLYTFTAVVFGED